MLHNRRKAEIEILASVPRKAAVCGSDSDAGRLAGHHSGTADEDGNYLTMSKQVEPTEPPSRVDYLVDKINAIVDTYTTKYT